MIKNTINTPARRRIPISDFRILFEKDITVKAIYEDLYCVWFSDSAKNIFTTLSEKGFDVAGVRKSDDSSVCGYIRRQELIEGTCGTHTLRFDESNLMSDSTPLVNALYLLSEQPYWFILKDNNVRSIVTRADLQKPPIRILIFGVITLLEMNFTDLIRKLYGKSDWATRLSKNRREAAYELLWSRQKRQEEIDLLECTQLCDKRDLIKHSEEARRILGFSSKAEVGERLKAVLSIRDQVAHGQDLVSGSSWKDTIRAIKDAEHLIERCENFIDGRTVGSGY